MAWPNNVNSVAIFGGTPGTATIPGGAIVSANGLTFNVSGYHISSGNAADVLTLSGAARTINVTTAGHLAFINSVLAGSEGLTKAGAGTLVLTGAHTYTGDTTITGGSVQLGNGGTSCSISGRSHIITSANTQLVINRSGTTPTGSAAQAGWSLIVQRRLVFPSTTTPARRFSTPVVRT